MIVIPAIDLRGGKCVRLLKGEFSQETVYSDNPIEMAKKWVSMGATRMHVIDLDGALTGELKNTEWVAKIKKETGIFVQVGGGIRTLKSIETILGYGIDRVILGTIVLEEAGLAQAAFAKFGDRIMVALDARDGLVASRGWKADTGVPLLEAISIVEKLGGHEINYTDISRDGAMEGVNFESIKDVMSKTPLTVYASGGVTSMDDIRKLCSINSPGCIVGKSIYEGKLDLREAIQYAASC